MEFRRFELVEKDPARIEELEAILNRAGRVGTSWR